MRTVIILMISFSMLMQISAQQKSYTSDWESLEQRPTPQWFEQARFGIFIHWGVYSVPSYRNVIDGKDGVYAEWYAPDVMYKPWRNDDFHVRNYGSDFTYRDFGKLFRAELWDPKEWADIFAKSGAKYVVLTAKHHDGFCLWDTKDSLSTGWNSMDTGPKRDLTGELSTAVRSRGMKFGVYYSLLEWETTQTGWPHDDRYANERTGYYIPQNIWEEYHIEDSLYVNHLHFQLKELVNRYSPDLIFADGAWDYPDNFWNSTDFISWLYNNAPNKKDVLVNDRWGNNTQGIYGDYYTSEYNHGSFAPGKPWEECQGLGYSFGYNRAESLADYKSPKELISLLCRTVSNGGNLLLNIGPTSDGRIPVIQQQRLEELGKWLKINGKAIYNTTPAALESPLHTFTGNGSDLYAFQYEWTQGTIKIKLSAEMKIKNCKLLGHDNKLVWKQQGTDLLIFPPVISPDNENVRYVYVFHLMFDQN